MGGPAKSQSAWERFRERAVADWPGAEHVRQLRDIEYLLAAPPDTAQDATANVVGALDDRRYEIFRQDLVLLSALWSAQAGQSPGSGPAQETGNSDPATGPAPRVEAGQAAASRYESILTLRHRVEALRSGQTPFTGVGAAAGSAQPDRDPAIAEATSRIFSRYSAAVVKIVPGAPEGSVIEELSVVLSDFRELQARTGGPGSVDWADLQWLCAEVLEALGRASRLQRMGGPAIRYYTEAHDAWSALDQQGRANACLATMADLSLLERGDSDEALQRLLAATDGVDGTFRSLGHAQAQASVARLFEELGDPIEAAKRAQAAGEELVSLGFADPATNGVQAAFEAWMSPGPESVIATAAGNEFLALLSTAVGTWASLTAIPTPDRGGEIADVTGVMGDLAGLANEMQVALPGGGNATTYVDRLSIELGALELG